MREEVTGSGEGRLVALLARLKLEPQEKDEAERIIRREKPDWKKVRELAVEERVCGLLYANLKKLSGERSVPPALGKRLEEHYAGNAARNVVLLSELREVLRALRGEDITVMVLKGAWLLESVYGNVALRPLEDIDLLVKERDILRAGSALARLGFSPGYQLEGREAVRARAYRDSVMYRKEGFPPVLFHLHWHLVNPSLPMAEELRKMDMSRIWERAVEARFEGETALVMHPSHALIYLATHAMKHSFSRLILLTDLCELLSTMEPARGKRDEEKHTGWDDVLRECSRFNLERPLYYSLSLCRELLGGKVPEEILRTLKPQKPLLGEKIFFFLVRRNIRLPQLSYAMYMVMVWGRSAKPDFLLRTFFPPRERLAAINVIPVRKVNTFHYFRRLLRGLTYGLGIATSAASGLLAAFLNPRRGVGARGRRRR